MKIWKKRTENSLQNTWLNQNIGQKVQAQKQPTALFDMERLDTVRKRGYNYVDMFSEQMTECLQKNI